MSHEAGKGDKRRPTNQDLYDKHYENIFGKKPPVRDHIGALPIEVCHELFGTKEDKCQKENQSD